MSSDMRKTILNTRERWTSSKYNKQVQLHDRNLQESLRALTNTDEDLSGVLSGLIVAVNAGTFQVTVGRGLALLFDGTKVAPDSQFRWIEIETSTTVTVPAADPVNPRWDVIEIAPGVSSPVILSRDIFDPSLGTFTSQNVTVEESSAPVVQVTSGTAAASPALPAGSAGQIPLAYIFVPAAAATLPTDGLAHCRPILRAPGAVDVGSDVLSGLKDASVRGGGIDLPAASATLLFFQASGRFPKHRIRWGVTQAAAITPSANTWETGAAPAADTAAYVYAAPPPFPAGYVGLAPREFVPDVTAVANIAGATTGVTGCILVTSEIAPAITAQGAHSTGGTIALSDPVWAATLSNRTQWAYIGAAFYDQSVTQFETQVLKGDMILPLAQIPNLDLLLSSPRTLWGAITGNFLFPLTALEVEVQMDGEIPVNTLRGVTVTDQTGLALNDEMLASSGGNGKYGRRHRMYPDPTNGNVTFSLNGTWTAINARSVAYKDAVLAMR